MPYRQSLKRQRAVAAMRERFVAEYLVDLNATQAYLRARAHTVTEKTAATEAYKLLRIPEIAQAVAAGQAKQLESLEMSASNVLALLWAAATLDPKEMFNDEWQLLPLSAMSPMARRTIEGIEVARANLDRTDGKKSAEFLYKIKHITKVKALEILAKHFNLLAEVVVVKGDWDKLAARLASARQRVEVIELPPKRLLGG